MAETDLVPTGRKSVMHERTGAMAVFETDEDAEAAGYTKLKKLFDMATPKGRSILNDEVFATFEQNVNELMGMNRRARRAWASRQRKKKPLDI